MKKRTLILIVTGALTLIITAVMNLWLLPVIEEGTSGMRFFDMNTFGYSYGNALTFLSGLSQRGRETALHIQLPLDFVYPVIYTVFFTLAIRSLTDNRGIILEIFPFLLFIFDYIENICSIYMLKISVLSPALAKTASIVTVTKNALMYLTFVIIAVLLIIFLIGKKRGEKSPGITSA